MFPGLFLDRDGVLIKNCNPYVLAWEQVEFLPGTLAVLKQLRTSPYKLVIVTNQAGIGRGLLPRAVVDDINCKLVSAIENAGGQIHGVYVCPHRPEDGCPCRKPQPGLLLQAARDLDINLHASIMIGDMLSDIGAGQAAGVAHVALVRTGNGAKQAKLPQALLLPPFSIFDHLAEAVACLTRIPSE